MNAYQKCYLDDAMRNLGEAVEYAVLKCSLLPDRFMEMFIAGGLAEGFEHGVPRYVSGMSGTELAVEVLHRAGLHKDLSPVVDTNTYSEEYWSGWILARYQWECGLRFRDIIRFLPLRDIIRMYPALHEASEERFVYAADQIRKRTVKEARLQQIRRLNDYSQRMLAERSGVSLRMIQQYEQGAKDIRKASTSGLLALAGALHCDIEDLICD